MKKILFWGLLLLAAACSRSSEEPDLLFSPNAPEPSSSWVRSQDDALETLAAMRRKSGGQRVDTCCLRPADPLLRAGRIG